MPTPISTVIYTGHKGQFANIVYISDKKANSISEVSRKKILLTEYTNVTRGCYERNNLPNKFTIITVSTHKDPITNQPQTIGEKKIEYTFSDEIQYLKEAENGECIPFDKDELKNYVNGPVELWDDISQQRIFLSIDTTSWIKMRKQPKPYRAIACLLAAVALTAFYLLKPEMFQSGFNALKSLRKA
jgi:hypothetical protein